MITSSAINSGTALKVSPTRVSPYNALASATATFIVSLSLKNASITASTSSINSVTSKVSSNLIVDKVPSIISVRSVATALILSLWGSSARMLTAILAVALITSSAINSGIALKILPTIVSPYNAFASANARLIEPLSL